MQTVDELKECIAAHREEIEEREHALRGLCQDDLTLEMHTLGLQQKEECRANLDLACRYLEDARMRLGNAIRTIERGAHFYGKQDDD